LDIEPKWHEDGPELPVEFARVSGGDRLTLVLVDGAPIQRTLWALSRKTTLGAAVEDLRSREKTNIANIGSWHATRTMYTGDDGVAPAISAWAGERGLDAVVWTALGPKKPNGENGIASSSELMDYLRNLVGNGKEAAAREYVEKAPAQIDTPFRRRVSEELGWL
jgi:hypothetical protein